jgi:DNA-binding beta-propeller fold protein YncE
MGSARLRGHSRRCVTSALTLASVALGLAAAPALASNAACPGATSSTATSCTFTNAGTPTFTVPTSVESVDVVAVGAAGGASNTTVNNSPAAAGGTGASVEDTAVPVGTGDVLNVVVGGAGQNSVYEGNAAGGTPGGGGAGGPIPSTYMVSGAGGGGFSGVLDASSTPFVIAGGGGGAGGFACTGSGGGGAGDAGSGGATGGQCGNDGGTPGTGGSATAPGQAGATGSCPGFGAPTPAEAGSSLQGGRGGGPINMNAGYGGGGGGGGGYYGGGGGGTCNDAGGGGGGSYGITGLTNEKLATGPASVTISWAEPATFLRSLGNSGSGNGQFSSPQGVTVLSTPGGPVTFVADYGNRRLESFTSSGSFLDEYPVSGNPVGVAGDFGNGHLYVAEPSQGVLRILSLDGTDQLNVGLTSPTGVAADPLDGSVYVTDPSSGEVYKIDGASGSQLAAFSDTANGGTLGDPTGVAFDPSTGDVYVADAQNDDIVVYDSNGNYLRQFGRKGTAPGRLGGPAGVALDPSSGEVFVVDAGNDRVERFRPSGTFTGVWGGAGAGYGRFRSPWGVALLSDGSFYVSDSNNDRVEKFGRPGALAKFVIGVPSLFTAGTAHTVTITPEDAAGNVIGDYAGSPTWSDSSGQLSGAPATFSGGESRNTVTLNPARAEQITVTDGSVTSTSRVFNVVGPLAKFAVAGPGTGSAGTASTVTIKAEDSAGNLLPSYAGSPTWGDIAGQVSGHPAAFSDGQSTNSVTFANAVRNDRITVADGPVSGQSAPFSRVGPLAQFTLTTPTSMTTGSPVTLTLTARDGAGNRVTSYAGTPTWSDKSGQVTGSPATFSGGISQTTLTFAHAVHADVITVQASPVSSPSKTFSVVGPLATFAIHVPASATHNTPFPVTIDAQDSAGNVVKTYTRTPTWSDTSGQLSGSPAAFSGGVSTNEVTLASSTRLDRIRVTDGGVTKLSGAFPVN